MRIIKDSRHYRAIILILASHHNQLVRNCRKVWLEYLDRCPDIKVLFVYGDSANFTPEQFDLVYPHIEENYIPGMLRKTVKAFEYIEHTYSYDFLVRTNIGTFWDFDSLLDHLSTLPNNLCYSGHGPHNNYYLSGTDTIVARHMIHEIVARQDELNYELEEDAAMGDFFHRKLGADFLTPRIFFIGGASGEGLTINFDNIDSVKNELALGMQSSEDKGLYQSTTPKYYGKADHYRVKNKFNRDLFDLICYVNLLSMIYNINSRIDFEGVL